MTRWAACPAFGAEARGQPKEKKVIHAQAKHLPKIESVE